MKREYDPCPSCHRRMYRGSDECANCRDRGTRRTLASARDSRHAPPPGVDPDREARIRALAERAAKGLPLFGRGDDE